MIHLFSNFLCQITRITQTVINRHYCDKERTIIIPLSDIKRFLADCFCSLGTTPSNSEVLADALVEADYRGVFSHGVSQLEKLVQEAQNGICNAKAEPNIEHEFTSVALVHGNDGFGHVTGKFCMDIALEKALSTGVGMVAAKGSNYFGMASLYTIQAAKKGFIGLSFSNSSPLMVPPGGLESVLGSNPLSMAAPAHCETLVVDMTTTAVNLEKIEQYKQNRIKLPPGWAVNQNGKVEQDPKKALKYKMLSPLGGDQNHKGFGLGLIVEGLSGLLADSNYGRNIPIFKENCKEEPPNIGHSFIAVNPEKFVPNFATRLTKLLNSVRNIETIECNKPVYVPGDKERLHMKKVDSEGGIRYSRRQISILEDISKKLDVQPIEPSVIAMQ